MNNNTRIITCQGTIQLLAALNAVQSQVEFSLKGKFTNVLLIYGLYSTDEQTSDFNKTIELIANNTYDFSRIIYIDNDTVNKLKETLLKFGRNKAKMELNQIINIHDATELYLCRKEDFFSMLLLNTYSDAYKICYGDSLNIYYSEEYYYKTFTGSLKIPKHNYIEYSDNLKQKVLNYFHHCFTNRAGKLKNIEFDKGYFFIPKVDASPPFPFDILNISSIRDLLLANLNIINTNVLTPFLQLFEKKNITLFLSSNFSEGNRLPQEDELSLYKIILKDSNCENDIIIYKPHPRDSFEKIKLFTTQLKNSYKHILLLTDSDFFYVPIEIILFKIMELIPLKDFSKTKVICFSSAALSFPILFNLLPILGFGKEVVEEKFNHAYKSTRIIHEDDLNKLILKFYDK